MLGRRVATLLKSGALQAGWHTIRFDASGLPSGVYTLVLTAPRGIRSQTVTLLK